MLNVRLGADLNGRSVVEGVCPSCGIARNLTLAHLDPRRDLPVTCPCGFERRLFPDERAQIERLTPLLPAFPPRIPGEEAIRIGWDTRPCPVPGLDAVDETFCDLITDLQRMCFTPDPDQAFGAFSTLSRFRRGVVALAVTAMEAHHEAGAQRDALREELRGLSGEALERRWLEISSRLPHAISWIPSARRRYLQSKPPWFHPDAPRFSLTEILEHSELPHLAYLAVTASGWEGAAEGAREYAELNDYVGELEAEHKRREAAPPGVATLVLATGLWPVEEKIAGTVLETYLPMASVRHGTYGGDPEDRLYDYPQELHLRVIELLAKLRGQAPEQLLARLYDGDKDLTHLPHAAKRDFQNWRNKGTRKRKAIPCPACGAGEVVPPSVCARCGVGIPTIRHERDEPFPGVSEEPPENLFGEVPDLAATSRLDVESLLQLVQRQFKHTHTERKILEVLLTDPNIDPRDRNFVSTIAQRAGCQRETASRYLTKLKRCNPSPLKGFLKDRSTR